MRCENCGPVEELKAQELLLNMFGSVRRI